MPVSAPVMPMIVVTSWVVLVPCASGGDERFEMFDFGDGPWG
jgi:hypothetical protein